MSILESVIGLLTPPECINCAAEGSALCVDCSVKTVLPFGERCWRCNRLSPQCKTCPGCLHAGGPSYLWITTDYESKAQELIRLYKFGQQRVAGQPIARLMAETFLKFNSTDELIKRNYLIVPAPTATSRARHRGFDHTKLLAKNLAVNLRMERADLLGRLGQTRQLGSARQERLIQLADSFIVKNRKRVARRNILLIDDVLTTGGTLIAATKVLKSAGAKSVSSLVFAKRL